LLERMRANPRDWRMEDVATICAAPDVELEPPRGGGSHRKVRDHRRGQTLIIPAHKPINPVYIRKLVALIGGDR
jgi:hypothetical protein